MKNHNDLDRSSKEHSDEYLAAIAKLEKIIDDKLSQFSNDFDPNDIDPDTFAQIGNFLDRGDAYLEADEFEPALEVFESALALLPKNTTNWALNLNVRTAIGETFLFLKDYQRAHDVLTELMYHRGAIDTPYIHMRLGQAQFELRNFERAAYELAIAFKGGGEYLFEGEDPKYLDFVKSANLG